MTARHPHLRLIAGRPVSIPPARQCHRPSRPSAAPSPARPRLSAAARYAIGLTLTACALWLLLVAVLSLDSASDTMAHDYIAYRSAP